MKAIETIFTLPGLETIMNSSISENEPFQFKAAFWHFENDASFYMFSDKQNYKMLIANDKFLKLVSDERAELDALPHYQMTISNPIEGLLGVIDQIEPTNDHYLLVINDIHDNSALVCMESVFDLVNLSATVGQNSLFSADIKPENTFTGEDGALTVIHW